MYETYYQWRDSARAVYESPNAAKQPPWLLSEHPAMWQVFQRYPDVFRTFTLGDYWELQRQFWRRWRKSPAATDELLLLLACRIARLTDGPPAAG